MEDAFLQELLSTHEPAEKAAIVAEFVFSGLPEQTVFVARQCAIFHWFDRAIVEALLQDTSLSKDETKEVYEQIVSLPFIENLAWGKTFQDLTREGLLKRYAIAQPKLFKMAARLAAPIYETHVEDEKIVPEALFCYLVAGDQQSSLILLNKLVEQASSRGDWNYIRNLLRLQDEGEQLPFVQPLPLTEHYCLLRGLVHRVQGHQETAIRDYSRAIIINPKSVLAYLTRGTIYAEQQRYDKALADYNYALRFDSSIVQVYANRGIIYLKQEQYSLALQDFASALQLDPNNTFVLNKKGAVLNEIGHHEEALAAFEQALQLDSGALEAYLGKGNTLYALHRYKDALEAYEQALHLNRNAVDAYKGKANTLYALKRYEEASATYEQAHNLDVDVVDADSGRLTEHYESESSSVDRVQEEPVSHNLLQQSRKVKRESKDNIANTEPQLLHYLENRQADGPHKGTAKDRPPTKAVPSHIVPRKRVSIPSVLFGQRLAAFTNASAAVAIVVVILFSFILLFEVKNATVGGYVDATATANAIKTTVTANAINATAHAQANATAVAYSSAVALGSPVLDDPLQDNSGGNNWDATGNCTFAGGNYHSSISQKGFIAPCFAQTTNFSNFAYQVQMTIVQGDQGGIAFRGDASKGTFYYFHISRRGIYGLETYTNYNSTSVLIQGPTPAIKTGLNQTNLIAIVANGNNLVLYVNTQQIASVNDGTYSHGQIGVIAESVQNPTYVGFTNAEVWVR